MQILRLARAILGGKKSAKVESRVSDTLKDGVRRRWNELGFQSESEYIEYVLTVDVFGPEHIQMMQEKRLGMVCRTSDSSPTGASR